MCVEVSFQNAYLILDQLYKENNCHFVGDKQPIAMLLSECTYVPIKYCHLYLCTMCVC